MSENTENTPTATADGVETTPIAESIVVPTRRPLDAPAGGEESILADLKRERLARQAAEAKVREFEDATKSDSEKAAARAEAAEKRAAEAEAKALRADIADELNVPRELRKFLTASDEEALRSQASELVTAFTAVTAASRTTPRPDPTQGAKPDGTTGLPQLTSSDASRMTPEQVVAARKAGQFNDLLGVKT